jgi:hypothetical protein
MKFMILMQRKGDPVVDGRIEFNGMTLAASKVFAVPARAWRRVTCLGEFNRLTFLDLSADLRASRSGR